MPVTEKLSETYDMYDEFDCEVEEEAKTVEVKEEEDLQTDDDALRGVDQPAGNVVKTEDQDETSIDMFDDKFHEFMEREFPPAETRANGTSEAVRANEEHETDFDATEVDEDQSAGNETVVKTEDQDETSIDMFDDKFHEFMEREFPPAETRANGTSEAVRANEEHETDFDATEVDEDQSAGNVSEIQKVGVRRYLGIGTS
ncbi:hypothetical protein TYRP_013818 [Tyrophagus putrescentiae]|nr:hypothetical protein TYRP_013818 [Tyrophagus putrescentiae]